MKSLEADEERQNVQNQFPDQEKLIYCKIQNYIHVMLSAYKEGNLISLVQSSSV